MFNSKRMAGATLAALAVAFAGSANAADGLDKADTAWVMLSSLLVLLMVIPGLALFYGGLVKKDNVLTTLMQTFTVTCIVCLLWPIIVYSLAFTEGNMFIGGLSRFMLNGMSADSLIGSIPETVFLLFQLKFAAITAALLLGSIADRVKFSGVIMFSSLWVILVYGPVAHWVWGPGGFIGGVGLEGYKGILGFGTALDFAGGTVVHITSGVAGLVAALVLGKRAASTEASLPNNIAFSVIGASLLWVGWFGFNAGSTLVSGTGAGMAMLVTNTAAAAAALTWIAVEWVHKGKPSVVGGISGAIAGLVAITPAAGFVGFSSSIIFGLFAGVCCYLSVVSLKAKLKYDDSLDVFGIHGIGGIVGAILTGVFATNAIGSGSGLIDGNAMQVMAQLTGVVVTVVYTAVVTWILIKITEMTVGFRVDKNIEESGLDIALHGEKIHA